MTRSQPTIGPRAGHYVDGRHYSLNQHAQARARATFLAGVYGRAVQVLTRYEAAGAVGPSFTAGNAPSIGLSLINCIGA